MGGLEEEETPTSATIGKMLEKKDNTDVLNAGLDAKAAAAGVVISPGADKKLPPLASSPKTNSPVLKNNLPSKVSIDMDADDATKSKGSSGEEVIDVPTGETVIGDSVANDDNKISKEELEGKPKKIRFGGLKLPGFFLKSKSKGDGDTVDGELLEKERIEYAAANNDADGDDGDASDKSKSKDDEKRVRLSESLLNFFVRKPFSEKQQHEQPSGTQPNGDTYNKSEATAEAANADSNNDQNAPPPKRSLLNIIKLPIAKIMPHKKAENAVEKGIGKAELASMENLNDSLKSPDCVDETPSKNNGNSASGEIKDEAAAEKLPKGN